MIDRIFSIAVAVTLAFLIWLHARNRDQEILDNVPIPVTIALSPADAERYSLEVNGPSQILATFTGPPSRLRDLREQIHRGEISLNVVFSAATERSHEARYLDTIRVRNEDLPTFPGVRGAVIVGQNRIPITVRRLIERPLQVRLDHALEDRISQCVLEPATVIVRGPQEVLERMTMISTRPYSLPTNVKTDSAVEVPVSGQIALVREIDGQEVRCEPSMVTVKFQLKPPRRAYKVQVPVQFLCSANCPWQPQWVRTGDDAGQITLTIVGPDRGDDPPPVSAFVDLTGREFQFLGDLKPRRYESEPIQLQLPKEYSASCCPPRSEAFLLCPRLPQRNEKVGFGLDAGIAP